jgi:hypothetical protein
MLRYDTITTQTLELLIKLQKVEEFSNLRLVGGTALAMQIGHRQSVDIDLFGQLGCDEYSLAHNLNSIGKVIQLKKSKNINIFSIDNIKVDIVNYPYPWIVPAIIDSSILLADKIDIAAMKLSAITGRGTKKDFIDLFFLFNYFTLPEMLQFYKQKYADGSEFLVLRSLSYFDDADEDEPPVMLLNINWEFIKEKIKSEVKKLIS